MPGSCTRSRPSETGTARDDGRVQKSMVKTYDKPFLLCVGAQKSATSWLAEMMRTKTPVWVGAFKGFHYFDRYSEIPSVRVNGDKRFHDRFKRLTSELPGMRDVARNRLIWLLDRLLIDSDESYAEYIAKYSSAAPAAADFTPEYATLPQVAFERMKAVLPNATALYMMRDPVARAWSGAKHRVSFIKSDEPILTDLDRFLRFLDEPLIKAFADYPTTMQRLQKTFPEARIGFYEEVLESDETALAFINVLLGDLGLDPLEDASDIRKQVYAGQSKSMPEAWVPVIREKLDPVYKGLSDMGLEVPKTWL